MEQGIRIRTVALLWLLLLAVSSVQAQSAGDIDTLSQWRVDDRHDFPPWGSVYDHFKYYISGTMTIDSQEYFKIYKSGYSYENPSNPSYYEHEYFGGLREEDNRWYTPSGLLYDFTMSVGDTVESITTLGATITVISVDTILVDGSAKRRLQLDNAGWGYGEEYIIEDVGATTGLFEALLFFENESELGCYAIDYTPLWLNPEWSSCDLTVSIVEVDEVRDMSIYPNPFTTSTTLQYELTEPSHVQLAIYNAIGEEVYKAEDRLMSVGKHTFIWSADRLPEGLYYSVLRSEKWVKTIKMIRQH